MGGCAPGAPSGEASAGRPAGPALATRSDGRSGLGIRSQKTEPSRAIWASPAKRVLGRQAALDTLKRTEGLPALLGHLRAMEPEPKPRGAPPAYAP